MPGKVPRVALGVRLVSSKQQPMGVVTSEALPLDGISVDAARPLGSAGDKCGWSPSRFPQPPRRPWPPPAGSGLRLRRASPHPNVVALVTEGHGK